MQRDYVPLFRSICTSDKFADLPDHECRLFYVLLLSQCDSWGRITDSPRALCAQVWGMFGGTVSSTMRALDALNKVGLIERLGDNGIAWIQVTNWEANAGSVGHPDRRGKSKFPGPSPDLVRSTPVSVLSEQSRAEERRTEESRAEKKRAPRAAAPPLDLDQMVAGSSLDTPQAKAAVKEWVAYKSERREAYTPRGLKALLSKLSSWGPARTEAAVRNSMASNWAGLFEPQPGAPNGHATEPKGFRGIRDYMEKHHSGGVS